MKLWIFVQFCTAWRRRKHQEKLTNTVAPPVHKGQLAGKFYIWNKYVYSATSNHTLLFLLNPCQSQSGPPGQIMRAGSLIMADISLAKFR